MCLDCIQLKSYRVIKVFFCAFSAESGLRCQTRPAKIRACSLGQLQGRRIVAQPAYVGTLWRLSFLFVQRAVIVALLCGASNASAMLYMSPGTFPGESSTLLAENASHIYASTILDIGFKATSLSVENHADGRKTTWSSDKNSTKFRQAISSTGNAHSSFSTPTLQASAFNTKYSHSPSASKPVVFNHIKHTSEPSHSNQPSKHTPPIIPPFTHPPFPLTKPHSYPPYQPPTKPPFFPPTFPPHQPPVTPPVTPPPENVPTPAASLMGCAALAGLFGRRKRTCC